MARRRHIGKGGVNQDKPCSTIPHFCFVHEETPTMNLSEWIGKSECVSDLVTATPYAALSATLDYTADRPAQGTPLPALWHWLYFLPL